MANDYKNSLNLPATDFPMRANLPQREPVTQEKWMSEDIYGKMVERNTGKEDYVLHDGPPFSNGNIHMGTALNKILKDFINKYKSMSGYRVSYVPGWDNHGMPIESAIIKKSKLDRKRMSAAEFRSACHAFAEDFVQLQMASFKRLGVLGDWNNPYRTMDPAFEAEEVKVFGEMYKKGYIYKGLKPVYWCPHDETALAEAEIEYKDDTCTSIFVKFRVKDDKGLLDGICDKNNTYFVIWTTTTWTLPGNMAIALHPRETYAVVKAGNENYIVAEALAGKVMAAGNVEDYEIIATFKGGDFEYATAYHPFLERDSMLVTAEYVTMDSGTGCVHTAPGFGVDDYYTGMRYGIRICVPVDDRGYQTEEAGKYAGMFYSESNKAILADMAESGALFASQEMVHQYPHCWRCKHPIIFRATPQWFCSVESFREEALKAAAQVNWMPAWGGDRMASMIRERADWCISRQRQWGLPIPVFYCNDCGKPVSTPESISKISALFDEYGSNVWFEKTAMELVPDGFTCPHCGGKEFEKETDTLDCWFDSGSTHYASLMHDTPELWPADVYLEGADQYRGWFQASLLTSVGALDKGAPFKQVLTHGWVVDGQGRAMHKSLGNGVDPADLIKDFGADIVRLWAASSDYHADVRCSKEIFSQLSESYRKIRNTVRILMANVSDFDPDNDMVAVSELYDIDKWALSRLNKLVKNVIDSYNTYAFHVAYHEINNFCSVELSKLYVDITKDRVYTDAKDGKGRRAAQSTMYIILSALTRLLAPI
ncbi:MAG: isoleucine--tRNA ligase, partial [Clostridia bacterium]|nr:isoleucine--tRNA ligase [Clostridia bacterium]